MKPLAIVVLTQAGEQLGCRLAAALGRGEVVNVAGATRTRLTELFTTGRPLVCVMALGIVVRVLGPVVGAKATGPPVVVVDDAGRFAVSVLGGHQGGANALAREVAAALGATPVITTASDVHGLPAVDLIGQSLGWTIDPQSKLTEVAAAVVRGERVAVYQDQGDRDWWQEFGEWPANFQRIKSWPQKEWAAVLAITDLWYPLVDRYPTVLYRPPTLVAGIGCRRGAPTEAIEQLFLDVCEKFGFSPLSLAQVATVTLKADEPGLLEFARRRGVTLRCFTPEELAAVADVPTPSERVRSKIGIPAVSEPAARLASGASFLLVPKQKSDCATLALARIEAP